MKKRSRILRLLFCIVCLGVGLVPSRVCHAQAQQQPADAPAGQLNADFQAVKARAAEVQQEMPRLDQSLEALAARLRERADLSVEEKAARLARLARARAVLRAHDETLRRAAARESWTSAGDEIDSLAELLNTEGDALVNVIADENANAPGGDNAAQLAAAHMAYRKAVTELVDAARMTRERARAAREQSRPAGESKSGKGDKQ